MISLYYIFIIINCLKLIFIRLSNFRIQRTRKNPCFKNYTENEAKI